MSKLRRVLIASGITILVLLIGYLLYYVYASINYFSTPNAQVTADMITITPEITGKLKEWNVETGDQVQAGQILGKQDVSSLISSTALNPVSLANSADGLISKADIRAPIDGKIVMVNVVKGEVLSPGMEIATVARTDHMYIKANIEETDIFNIRPGQKVDIKIDAYRGQKF
ncbi:MAG: HlyD family efflux transporter periplasmic adaptor subunit, partial [Syntrophomonadaceae bacterium]|nr:HlyD family efflux transporter periplasmic adaptor subunit [Syntrophomonadaceae bacterium]